MTLKLTKPSDLDSLFTVWYKDEANQKAVKDAKEFTIDLETSDMKLGEKATVAQRTMTLNKALAGKTINVNILNSFAEIKNSLIFTIGSDIADKAVTITLPNGNAAFKLELTTEKAFVTLTSDGTSTLSRFELTNKGGVNRVTTLKNITVDAYKKVEGGLTVKEGASITAYAVTSLRDITISAADNGKGIPAGIKDSEVNDGYYAVNNLIAEGDVTINTTNATAVNKITIAANKTVILGNATNGNKHPYVNEVVGLGDATKGEASKVTIKDAEGLANIATLNNVTVKSDNSTVNVYAKNDFTKTTIEGTIKPKTTEVEELSGVIVASKVSLEVPDAEFTFTFDGVEFADGAKALIEKATFLKPIIGVDGEQAVERNFWYVIDIDEPVDWNKDEGSVEDGGGNYAIKHDEADIPAVNKEGDPDGGKLWGEDDPTLLFENISDVDIELVFNGGKYAGKAMEAKYVQELANPKHITNSTAKTAAAQATIKVGSKSYKWYNAADKNNTSKGYILVEK